MQKKLSSRGIKLAILGAALAVSGAALAVESAGPQRFHDRAGHHAVHYAGHGAHQGHDARHHGKRMHHHGHAHMQRAGLVVPGYGLVSRDFVDGMGLNQDQLKLIEDARKAAKDQRENRRELMKGERGAQLERYKNGTLDPEQALKNRAEQRQKAQAERDAVDQKWVAVWKSLDAGQQERVATHLKQRAEKAAERAKKFEERKQQREAARAERADGKRKADAQA